MRTAIWSAVSSKAQAEVDKTSLQDQVNIGMQTIARNQWTFTDKYIAAGESRTEFISLAHAEEKITELHRLLEDASKKRFEVLFVYDLNRFRNLMLQVFETLTDYNIQIYNHDDPTTIYPQEAYTPERKNANRLNVKLHDILSGQEINNLQKHYREKMPNRISIKRLHAGLGLPPYGYRKPPHLQYDKNAVLEIVPEEAAILIQIKEWFLTSGLSLTEIAKRLNAQNIPSPRGKKWWFSIIRYLLANQFYAGTVHFGATKRQLDKRKRTVSYTRATPITAQGLHTPIWDQETHNRIILELERRAKAQPGISTRVFTRILHCQCGAVLWAQVMPQGKYWHCSTLQKKHTFINDKKVFDLFIPQLIHDLTHIEDIPIIPPEDKRPQYIAEITALKNKKTRWMDAYENTAIEKDELTKRLQDINTRLDRTQRLLADLQTSTTRKTTARQQLQTLSQTIDILPHYIQTAEPRHVNNTLHTFIQAIHITKDHKLTIEYK